MHRLTIWPYGYDKATPLHVEGLFIDPGYQEAGGDWRGSTWISTVENDLAPCILKYTLQWGRQRTESVGDSCSCGYASAIGAHIKVERPCWDTCLEPVLLVATIFLWTFFIFMYIYIYIYIYRSRGQPESSQGSLERHKTKQRMFTMKRAHADTAAWDSASQASWIVTWQRTREKHLDVPCFQEIELFNGMCAIKPVKSYSSAIIDTCRKLISLKTQYLRSYNHWIAAISKEKWGRY